MKLKYEPMRQRSAHKDESRPISWGYGAYDGLVSRKVRDNLFWKYRSDSLLEPLIATRVMRVVHI